MPKTDRYITFWPRSVEEDLSCRASGEQSKSLAARRDLERYYSLLKNYLANVRLTDEEASLVVDALNGSPHATGVYGSLYGKIEDAIRLDALDQKWGVNGLDMLRKLREEISNTGELAIIDACERFWNLPEDDGDLKKKLRVVGLIR